MAFVKLSEILCNGKNCNKEAIGICSKCEKVYFCSETCKTNDLHVCRKTRKRVKRKRVFDVDEWFAAAKDSKVAELKEMLNLNGADVNVKGVDGRTALIFASRANNIKLVQLLLNAGADVNMLMIIDSPRCIFYVLMMVCVK